MTRRQTRQIKVGNIGIGSDHPVSIQSMANVPVSDTDKLVSQIRSLENAGCEIVRVALDSVQDAIALEKVAAQVKSPLVADIQFCSEAASAAILHGASAVRINPGLFRDKKELDKMAHLAAERNIPIRVGANSGSIGKVVVDTLVNRGMSPADALCQALVDGALKQCELLESCGVTAIKAALKASSVPITVAAYRMFAAKTDYPLHLGVTEAGTPGMGIVKSAAGIGALLLDGIGDTVRVSLTAPPQMEIPAAIKILEACQCRSAMPEIVSCPTCGRTEIDLMGLVEKVEAMISAVKSSGKKISFAKIAVMGCPVNGPGEAKDADLGIAGSRKGEIVLFAAGKVIGVYPEKEALAEFYRLLQGSASAD